MEKFLLASDFDGTLKRHPNDITQKDIEAIRRFRDDGNYFMIISGRVYETLEDQLRNFNGFDFKASCSGAYIADADGKLLHSEKGDTNTAYELLKTARDLGAYAAIISEGNKTYGISDFERIIYGEPISEKDVLGLSYFSNVSCYFHSVDAAFKASEVLKARYGKKASVLQNYSGLDIPPFPVTKAKAIEYIAKELGIKKENIYTAGDGHNDIDMLKSFHGRAVMNAADDVKTSAEKTVEDIAEIIEEILGK